MDPNTTSAIRDIFVMIAAGVFAVLCVVIILVFAKLYRPLRGNGPLHLQDVGEPEPDFGRPGLDIRRDGEQHCPDVPKRSECFGEPEGRQ